ncbi:MAG TPA: NAD(P)H-dependent oxidoreductase [Candidatus Monoglobus merdigallinarum]|uniref:NAD(P)H-dependent oxidoreductase n=1 Tax=Candidatus Monoglobus merdigallinarum TaxID=2838698 RepID=A0A9D1TL07_9FIRM|nr:NAD(P)H-dependent oxidoreductase [Candidatus Monoglobus merdigallinarum]
MKNVLVAYFSCTGTTAKLAETLAAAVGADIYEIEPKVPYTSADLNWHDKNSRSSREMQDASSRPEIAGRVADMDKYDTVFVGFPIWWYVAPTIINTFLESYDFSGKTVIPFATSGGSGVGESGEKLRASCSGGTEWKPARRFPGNASAEALKKWVGEMDL